MYNKLRVISLITVISIALSLLSLNFSTYSFGSDSWMSDLGLGSISTVPGSEGDVQQEIYKTSNYQGAAQTNNWSSSVYWKQFSDSMYPHPLAFRCVPSGLQVGYPQLAAGIEPNTTLTDANSDFIVEPSTFAPIDARADKETDWSIDIMMASGSKKMKATLSHGSPYAYFNFTEAKPKVVFKSNIPAVYIGDASKSCLAVRVNNNYYGLFAPDGSSWNGIGTNTLNCNLPSGKNYFSIALLPDNSENTFNFYKQHAYAFITDTKVEWKYNESDSSVTTTYNIITTPMEGTNKDTVIALYPHQWRNNGNITPLTYTYKSIRGIMKTIKGASFNTKYKYNGILAALPDAISSNTALKTKLQGFLDQVESKTPYIDSDDTYWAGKDFGRLANLLPIAEQIGDTVAAQKFLAEMKSKLENFLTYTPGESKNYFYYNKNWGTLIGWLPSFGSNNELNDHHFHYGYFINAAAQIALRDPTWVSDSRWGKMIKLIISDFANGNRNDTRFPFLRNFDPYAGHSWASGHSKFWDGNNQESSSEATNAYQAMILFGEAIKDTSIRDLGIYLYTTEIQAINNYWFNLYGDVFDNSYKHNTVGMVWGSKYVHSTWWTADPIEIHGINWMPITGASLYLAADPDYIKRNLDEMWAEVNAYTGADKNLEMWQDIVCEYLALYDPDAALKKWNENGEVEDGESRAHTYHWIRNLIELGRPDFTVTADTPIYSVFKKGSTKTYVVYNFTDSLKRVTFSDGKIMNVSPRSMGISNGTGIDPTPVQTQATPTPTPVSATPTSINTPISTISISDTLLIDDFNSSALWQAKKNDLNQDIVINGGIYNLEGDKNLHFFYNGGVVPEYFDTYINKNISAYDYLAVTIRGNVGGEESTLSISMNDGTKSSILPLKKYGTLSSSYKDIFIPLSDFGVNLSGIKYLRFAGTGSAQTVKIDEIKLIKSGGTKPTPTSASTPGSFSQDLNGDRVVNMSDVIILAKVFNTVKGDAKYLEACDLNGDGTVNMSDVIIMARAFNTVI
jgi:endoglucanase Acf2